MGLEEEEKDWVSAVSCEGTQLPELLHGNAPDTDTESSLPTVGVVAALMELAEEMEEVLSARAKGAMGGGLAEWTGGLNGRF